MSGEVSRVASYSNRPEVTTDIFRESLEPNRSVYYLGAQAASRATAELVVTRADTAMDSLVDMVNNRPDARGWGGAEYPRVEMRVKDEHISKKQIVMLAYAALRDMLEIGGPSIPRSRFDEYAPVRVAVTGDTRLDMAEFYQTALEMDDMRVIRRADENNIEIVPGYVGNIPEVFGNLTHEVTKTGLSVVALSPYELNNKVM